MEERQVFSTRYSGSLKFRSQVLNEGLDALEGIWQGMAWPRLREELRSLINRHAEYLFSGRDSLTAQRKGRRRPRRNHTGPGMGVHVRPPPLTPQGRRELRRANYKSLQSLYAKDHSRAAKTVLSGDWKPLGAPSPNIDSEGILELWKGIFEVQSIFDDRPVRPVRETQWDLSGVTASEVIEWDLLSRVTAAVIVSVSSGPAGIYVQSLASC